MTEGAEEGLELYRYKETNLPGGLEHFALAAYAPEPKNIRCKILGQHTDPDGYLWGLCRMNLKLLDPGFFQEGAVKEKLREVRARELKWREESLESFCKSHNLDLSIFPPIPEETKIPKFAGFGPKHSRLDKLLLKSGEIYSDLLFKAIVVSLIIGALTGLILILPFWPFNFFEKLLIVASPAAFIIPMACIANHIIRQGTLAEARSWPGSFIAHGRLNQLLKDLKEYQPYVIDKVPGFRTTSIHKSRLHPDKTAYSISIVSEVVLQSPLFTALIKPEKLVMHLEIVGRNLDSAPLVFSWYDTPRSIFLAKRACKIIEEIKNWMGIMRHQKIDMDSLLCWNGRKFPLNERERAFEKQQREARISLLEDHGLIVKENLNN